jgi:adenylate kinase family enzyme
MIITHLYHPPGQRLALIGLPGAGKTTLARQLSQQLALPHIELDALYWGANWRSVPQELFHQRIEQALSQDSWVAEGNYLEILDLICPQAETLIWLDLPLPVLLTRLLRRTKRNILSKTKLSHGNSEEWRRCFLSPRSIFLKLFKDYHCKRQAIKEQLNQPQYSHLRLIHLRKPQAVQTWLASLQCA